MTRETRGVRRLSPVTLLTLLLALLSPPHSLSAAQFGLFGDLTFVDSDAAGAPSSFTLGAVDFFVTDEIGERLSALMEVEVESEGSEVTIDVERLWVRYQLREAFAIAAGRFHTPLGYWNRTFHHGALIQDTIERPFFLDFEHDENGILPIHLVGLMATGAAYTKIGELRYEAVFGNGQELSSAAGLDPDGEARPHLDPNNLDDTNDNKSLGARLSLIGEDGSWEAGVFAISQKIGESGSLEEGSLVALGETLFDQTVTGVDVRFERGRAGVLAEYFDIDVESSRALAGGGRFTSTAVYAQIWVDLTESLRLVARHAELDTDAGDPYYRLLGRTGQQRDQLGVVYRMQDVSAIKLEVSRWADRPGLEDATVVGAQWAFLIP